MKDDRAKEIVKLICSYPILKVSVVNLKLDLEYEQIEPDEEKIRLIENNIRSKENVIKRMENAFNVLSEKDRKIVEMFYLKNMSIQDIADHIGISRSTVDMHKKNALSIMADVVLLEGEAQDGTYQRKD